MDRKDKILVIFAHDGVTIVECIKERIVKPFINAEVDHCAVEDLQTLSNDCKNDLIILLLTPEMVIALETTVDFNLLCSLSSTKRAIFHHESVDVNFTKVSSQLKTLPLNQWQLFPLEKVRSTSLRIIHLLDKEDENIPDVLQYKLHPKDIWMNKDDVLILFQIEVSVDSTVCVKVDAIETKAMRVNPYTYAFSPKDCRCGKLEVEVLVDGRHMGKSYLTIKNKKQLVLREINDVTSPLNVMSKYLHTSNLDMTDESKKAITKDMETLLEGLRLETSTKTRKEDTPREELTPLPVERIPDETVEPVAVRKNSEQIRLRRKESASNNSNDSGLFGIEHSQIIQSIFMGSDYDEEFPDITHC